jgi:hypothetical protein
MIPGERHCIDFAARRSHIGSVEGTYVGSVGLGEQPHVQCLAHTYRLPSLKLKTFCRVVHREERTGIDDVVNDPIKIKFSQQGW